MVLRLNLHRLSLLPLQQKNSRLIKLCFHGFLQHSRTHFNLGWWWHVLSRLRRRGSDEDLVHYALEGLSDRYDQVCGIMHHRDPFPDFKTARSMLITEEMRLKSKSLALPVDSSSSSPLVLMTQSGMSRRPSSPQVKYWRPCKRFLSVWKRM